MSKRTTSDTGSNQAQISQLAKISHHLNLLETPDELCNYLCHQVKAIIGQGYCLVSLMDESGQRLKVKAMDGFDDKELINGFLSIFKTDPRTMYYYIDDMTSEELSSYRSGKLLPVPDGLYAIMMHQFPRKACATAERLLGISCVYAIGFMHHDRHLGGLIILTSGAESVKGNSDLIEAIISQCSVMLGRMSAEKALRQSEEHFRRTFDQSPIGISISGLDFRFIQVNQTMCRMLGYSEKEMAGLTFKDITHPDDLSRDVKGIEKLTAGEIDRYEQEKRYIRKDGSVFWGHLSVGAIKDETGRTIFYTPSIVDITKRKKAEAENLRLNRLYAVISQVNQAVVRATSREQFLQSVCHIITEYGGFKLAWIGRLDAASQRVIPVAGSGGAREYVDGIVVYADERPEGLGPTGSCLRELKPFVQNDFMNDANTELWHGRARKFGLRGAAAFPIMMGGIVWGALSVYSGTAGYFGIKEKNLLREAANDTGFALDNLKKEELRQWAEDELHKTAEHLRTSEERFRTLYENSTIGIYRTTPDGRILLANPALVEMLGYDSFDELAKINLEEDLFGISYPRSQFIELIERDGEIRGLESSWKRKDGSRMYVRESARAIRDADGQTLYYDGTVEDITTRHQAEAALAEEVERRSKLFEQTPVGIIISDPDTMRFLEFNSVAHQQLGYTREEFALMSIPDVEADEGVEEIMSHMASISKMGRAEFETHQRTKKGKIRDVQVTVQVVNVSGRVVYQSLWRDITEHKRMEHALTDSEKVYRNLFNNTEVGMFRTLLDGSAILNANDKFLQIFGRTRREVIGKPSVMHWADSRQRDEMVKKLKARGRVVDFECRMLNKKGEVLDCVTSLNLNPADETLEGSIMDITERKKAEKALQQSEEKFRNLADQSPNIIFIHSGERIAYVNEAAVQIMGYSRDEYYSPAFDFMDLIAPDFKEKFKQSYSEHMQGKEVPAIEYVMVAKSGKHIDALIKTRLIDYEGRRAIMGTVTDITEHKHAEEERQRLEEKAQVASRLAAIGELAAGVAHEINNPLTSIIGFSELLLEQNLPREALDEIQIVADSSRRVADIVKRLLTFARQNKPVRTALNINALIDNTLKLRTYVLQTANIQVFTCYDQELPWLAADPSQLQQVFLNLIVNAEQAMKSAHNGGELMISTEHNDKSIRITFQDNGTGIPAENMQRLFEPFFTTKGPGEGTGLGLSLSRSIVVEHGGEMWAESSPGHGATFLIELPLSDTASASTPARVEQPACRKPPPPSRILVIDDEPTVRDLIQTTLTAEGHVVDGTGDPEEALRILGNNSYQLIFLDIRMPGMNGTELYQRILQKYPRMTGRVVFITGDTSDAKVRAFLKDSNLPCLAKPFEINELEEKVRSVLEAG